MPHKKIQISIPKPCSEDWSKMTPTERGRFCAMCTKEVVDFTKMSDEQLAKYISHSENSICGHIRKNQLNRAIDILGEPKSQIQCRPWFERILAATVFLFTLGSVKGQSQPNVNVVSQNQLTSIGHQSEQTISKPDESTSHEIILRGVVFDSLNNEPLPFANVVCNSFSAAASTDINGVFELKFDFNSMPDSIVLEIFYTGFGKSEFTVKKEDFEKPIEIYLATRETEISVDIPERVVIVGALQFTPVQFETKSQRFWRRMKFWKRRK